MTTKMVT